MSSQVATATTATTAASASKEKDPCSAVKRMMWIPLMLLVPVCVTGFFSTFRIFLERQILFESLAPSPMHARYPYLSDMRQALLYTSLIIVLRYALVRYVLVALGDRLLPTLEQKKGRWTAQTRAEKLDRFASCAFKFTYFFTITIVGYYVLRDTDFLPAELGGKGDIINCFAGYPFHPATATVITYYLVQLSYHFHSLIIHLWTGHSRSDFIEMALHHICAILLIFFSYYNNFYKIGAIVLFVHDIADVVGYAVKCAVDTSYTAATLTIYVTLLCSWGYTRLYVFPLVVIRTVLVEGKALIPHQHFHRYGYAVFEWMLIVLQFLHIYWYILFIMMGISFLSTGKTEDIQHRVGREEKDPIWTEENNPGVDDVLLNSASPATATATAARTATAKANGNGHVSKPVDKKHE